MRFRFQIAVMAGLVPAIHVVSCFDGIKDVDARHKARRDEEAALTMLRTRPMADMANKG